MKTSTWIALGAAAVVGYLYVSRKTAAAATAASGFAPGTVSAATSGLSARQLAVMSDEQLEEETRYEIEDDYGPGWGWTGPVWGGRAWGGGGRGRGGHHHGHGGGHRGGRH